jgi:hypothetical protein
MEVRYRVAAKLACSNSEEAHRLHMAVVCTRGCGRRLNLEVRWTCQWRASSSGIVAWFGLKSAVLTLVNKIIIMQVAVM